MGIYHSCSSTISGMLITITITIWRSPKMRIPPIIQVIDDMQYWNPWWLVDSQRNHQQFLPQLLAELRSVTALGISCQLSVSLVPGRFSSRPKKRPWGWQWSYAGFWKMGPPSHHGCFNIKMVYYGWFGSTLICVHGKMKQKTKHFMGISWDKHMVYVKEYGSGHL